ncbi:hypothetical protein [Dysgonomonas sp. ZJ709]|uniref:hypothetical protein n=1 Tax=Dysgonomonas sp. ZJ709 TaxID=2709797 RepID=UPI0013EC53ED|nr:hypothetical protein [Dysgonomonas sp. ZJ709]
MKYEPRQRRGMEISQKTGRESFYFRWNTKIPLPLNGKRQLYMVLGVVHTY